MGPAAAGARDALERALRDKDQAVRWWAVCALARLGDLGMLPHLEKGLAYDGERLRPAQAAERLVALSALAPDEVVRMLLVALQRTEDDVRSGYIRDAMHDLPAAAVPALLRGLTDPKQQRRVVGIIADMGDRAAAALPQIAELYGRCAPGAFLALVSMGEPALPVLRESLFHAPPDRIDELFLAIRWLGPLAVDAAPAVFRMLDDRNRWTRARAHGGLAELGPGVIPELLRRIESAKPADQLELAKTLCSLQQPTPEVLAGLRRLTRTDDESLNAGVATCIGLLTVPDSRAVPVLLERVRSGDYREIEAALKELTRLGPAARTALPELVRLCRTGPYGRGRYDEALKAIRVYR
jgi:HEAT repeat protein